jgi:hypothetical protein
VAKSAAYAAIVGASFGLPDSTVIAGRAFSNTPLHSAPNTESAIVSALGAESIHHIRAVSSDGWWYALEGGFVPRRVLQPILPYARPVSGTFAPGYYTVIAPITTLRSYCAAEAAAVARVGFGGVLYASDSLIDDHGAVWYALRASVDDERRGWGQALHLATWPGGARRVEQPALHLDVAAARW